MNIGRLRSALLPALVAFAAPLACADSDEAAQLNAQEDAGSTPDARPAPDAEPSDAGPSVKDASRDECSGDGFCRTALPGLFPLFSVSALGANDAWAVGAEGIVRWDGASWKLVHSMVIDAAGNYGIWTTKTDDMWFATTGRILRFSKVGTAAPAIREIPIDLEVTSSWVDPTSNVLWAVGMDLDGNAGVFRLTDDGEGGLTVENADVPSAPDTVPAEGEDIPSYRWSSVWGFDATGVYVGGGMCPYEGCGDEELHTAIAHYDGTDWTVSLVEAEGPVISMFGTTDRSTSRQLWFWAGPRFVRRPSITSTQLVRIENDGSIGASLVSEKLTVPALGAQPSCSQFVGSAWSTTSALVSNGCLVRRWDGTKFDVMGTAVNGVPIGRVNAVWAGTDGQAWLVGETVQLGSGFASHRSGSVAGANP